MPGVGVQCTYRQRVHPQYGVAWDYTTEASRYTPRWTSGMGFLSALIALQCYATEDESHLLRTQAEIDAGTRDDQ
jgi:hypothetical protein